MCTQNRNHINRGTVPEIRRETERIFCSFLLFHPSNNPENQNFENLKIASGDVIILHISTKDEIRSVTDVIFCRFGPFLAFFFTVDPKN